jgi:hypothetical protein
MFKQLSKLRSAQTLNNYLRSVDIAGCRLTELHLQAEKPEVFIRPDVASIGLLDAVDVREVVRIGEQAVQAALPQLRRVLSWRTRLIHRILLLDLFNQTNHVT